MQDFVLGLSHLSQTTSKNNLEAIRKKHIFPSVIEYSMLCFLIFVANVKKHV